MKHSCNNYSNIHYLLHYVCTFILPQEVRVNQRKVKYKLCFLQLFVSRITWRAEFIVIQLCSEDKIRSVSFLPAALFPCPSFVHCSSQCDSKGLIPTTKILLVSIILYRHQIKICVVYPRPSLKSFLYSCQKCQSFVYGSSEIIPRLQVCEYARQNFNKLLNV